MAGGRLVGRAGTSGRAFFSPGLSGFAAPLRVEQLNLAERLGDRLADLGRKQGDDRPNCLDPDPRLVEVDLDTGEIKEDPLGAQPRTRTEKGPRE